MDNILTHHTQSTPGLRGGKPCITGARIAVVDVATMHLQLGQSVDEIVAGYDLPLAAVHAALAYYYDHRDKIGTQARADEAFVAEFRRQHPSQLEKKLSKRRVE